MPFSVIFKIVSNLVSDASDNSKNIEPTTPPLQKKPQQLKPHYRNGPSENE